MDQLQSIPSKVQGLMAEVFEVPVEEISPDLAFGDLPQWDSLGHMDLMASLEQSFGLDIDTDLIAELVNFPAIVAHIEEKQDAGD